MLHLYTQYDNHDPAAIVGTKESLLALRDAIDRALENELCVLDAETNDGEGFDLIIIVNEHMDEMCLPYINDDSPKYGHNFYDLVKFDKDTHIWWLK